MYAALIRNTGMSADDGYYWDDSDDGREGQGDEQLPHDEWIRFGPGRWLILTTWPPDGHNCEPMPLAGAMLQFET